VGDQLVVGIRDVTAANRAWQAQGYALKRPASCFASMGNRQIID